MLINKNNENANVIVIGDLTAVSLNLPNNIWLKEFSDAVILVSEETG